MPSSVISSIRRSFSGKFVAWENTIPTIEPDPSSPSSSVPVNHPCFLCLLSSDYGRCEKLFWSIAAVFLSGVMVFISCNIILNYIRRPIIISVDNIDGTLQGAVFPAVTICNLNWHHLSVEWLDSKKVRQESTWKLLPINETNELDHNGTHWENGTQDILFTNMTLLRNVTISQHEKAHMLVQCTWLTDPMNCSDIFQSTVTEMGVCSTFNYGFPERGLKDWYMKNHRDRQFFQVRGVGRRNGLGVILDAKEGRHLPELDAIGFQVVVHPGEEVPLEPRGFLVSPGTLTSASIRVLKTETSEDVYNQWPAHTQKNCFQDTERYLRHYAVYSEANCFMECIRDTILDECQCVLPAIPAGDDENNTSICILKEQNDCARKIIDNLQVGTDAYYQRRRSHCQCKRRCSEKKFVSTVSIAKFPGKELLAKLRQEHNKSEAYIRNNFALLEIYFSDATYTQYTRDVSSTISELFGSVGGIIGGVLGCSLVTVCDVLFVFARWRWRRKRNCFKPPKIYQIP